MNQDGKRLLVFGAHPDDPESGCGGLIANAVDAGWTVLCLYATAYREDRTYFGLTEREVRSTEARAACVFLGAECRILNYEHEHIGTTHADRKAVGEIVTEWKPDIMTAHWPVDTHPDHRAAGTLGLDAFLAYENCAFYYFEVYSGEQSMRFHPTHYVDISGVLERKRNAVFCHESQYPPEIWKRHEVMHHFRGLEAGCESAEAYVRVDRGNSVSLPGIV
jgi:N-acetylglucosamine malate deacetylase 1